MEPEVRERFERIEATLALTAENHRTAMEQLDKRMAASEKRMDKRMMAFEKRNEKFEKSVRQLIVAGMRVVNHLAAENRKARADTNALRTEMREFKGEVRAYIKTQGNGHKGPNGNGRR